MSATDRVASTKAINFGTVEDTERAAQQMQGEPFGVLRQTCGVAFRMAAVSGWIDAYLRCYPDVRVEADFTSRLGGVYPLNNRAA